MLAQSFPTQRNAQRQQQPQWPQLMQRPPRDLDRVSRRRQRQCSHPNLTTHVFRRHDHQSSQLSPQSRLRFWTSRLVAQRSPHLRIRLHARQADRLQNVQQPPWQQPRSETVKVARPVLALLSSQNPVLKKLRLHAKPQQQDRSLPRRRRSERRL
jgi:hypothetical protein